MHVVCALTDQLAPEVDCLLTREDWKLLGEYGHFGRDDAASVTLGAPIVGNEGTTTEEGEGATTFACSAADREKQNGAYEVADVGNATAHRVVFRDEQRGDQSLKKAYEDARKGKGGMFLSNKLLYHRDSIAGTRVDQLVLPRSKREEVLPLAHESLWGRHLGPKKTKARIKNSFYWPGVEPDVAEHSKTCHGRQIRSERRRGDRVPITPLTRPDHPYQVVNVDVIGPMDAPMGRGYKYALCVLDLCTRWPEVVCLRSLTARATCDALL